MNKCASRKKASGAACVTTAGPGTLSGCCCLPRKRPTRTTRLCAWRRAQSSPPAFTTLRLPAANYIACDLELAERSAEPHQLQIGLEVVINLLAPNEPDRYFETGGRRYPLEWGGAVPA